jgi:hypothetical protein
MRKQPQTSEQKKSSEHPFMRQNGAQSQPLVFTRTKVHHQNWNCGQTIIRKTLCQKGLLTPSKIGRHLS